MLSSLTVLMSSSLALARAGGAGGGGFSGDGGFSGGGSGDGDLLAGLFELVFELLIEGGPVGWAVLAAIFVGLYYLSQTRASAQNSVYVPRSRPASVSLEQVDELPMALDAKVRKAFLLIQHGWSIKSTDPMRRFVTDGIYQRFHAQFTMMNLLEQTNVISDVRIESVQFARAAREGVYDVVDVCIQATAHDQFLCRPFPQLNSPGGYETFAEYWTFLRRTNHKKASSLFETDACPNCAAPLTGQLMESARCPYCAVYLNNGEYDWVLSEISQDTDYHRTLAADLKNAPAVASSLADVFRLFPAYSRQILEDRASNALMQILIATATGDEATLKRISTANGFLKLSKRMPPQRLLMNRLYTRAVDTLGVRVEGDSLRASVIAEYSAHTIVPSQGVEVYGDADPSVPHTMILLLKRELSDAIAKGSVYAGTCPHCGAPQPGNLSPKCVYCGEALNDPKLDWIVEDALTLHEFRALLLKAR